MFKWFSDNKIILLSGILLSASVPIFITGYEVIVKGKESVSFVFDSTIGVLVVFYYILLLLLGVSFLFYWLVKQIKTIIRLKNEKTNAELLHLKSQVNPHFFFNMLNNLYGWVDKDPSKAKDLILKLSDLMRYSIYDGQKDKVSLKEEIAFLQNYMELHRMRYHKNININVVMDVENEEVEIMPLLFIILVENAFKHGVETLRDNAFVNLIIKSTEKEILFEVKNNFDEKNKVKEGIGLQNLRKRLDIMYPKNHKLMAESNDGTFTAQLILTIL